MTEEKSVWELTKQETAKVWAKTKKITGDVWGNTKELTDDMWQDTKEIGKDVKKVCSKEKNNSATQSQESLSEKHTFHKHNNGDEIKMHCSKRHLQ